MKRYAFFVVIPLILMAFRPAADGKTYASFKGARQGLFKGNSGREREGWFVIESWAWEVKQPAGSKDRTAAPAGRPQHGPVIIRKQVDAASPLLLEALNTGEKLEVTIQMFDAGNKVMRNIVLKNAVVKGIHKDDWENVTFEYTDTVDQP